MKGFILKPHEASALAEGKPVVIWRVCKPQPEFCGADGEQSDINQWGWMTDEQPSFLPVTKCCPFPISVPLYGKETWCEGEGPIFRAEWDADERIKGALDGAWRSATTMPERIARTTLVLSNVRVRRPCDVTEEEAKAMGFSGGHDSISGYAFSATPKEHWRHQWKHASSSKLMLPSWNLYHWSALATPQTKEVA